MSHRSKSMHENSSRHDYSEGEEKHLESSWSAEEQMKLIAAVRSMIPTKDKLPFEERLQRIDWDMILIENREVEAMALEFDRIINNERTFRLLDEILQDAQKNILPALGLEKPVTSFVLFTRDYKDEIVKMCSTLNQAGNYVKIAADMYKNISDRERNRYEAMAKELKSKYNEATKKYIKKKVTVPKSTVQYKYKKDSPCTLYIKLRKNENAKVSSLALRNSYQEFDKEKKLKWILRWLGLKKGQKANMEQYKKCMTNLSKNEMVILDEYEGRPQMQTGFKLFIRDYIANASYENSLLKGKYRLGSEEWKKLSEHEKSKYIERARRAKRSFTVDFSRFISSLPEDRRESELNRLSKLDAKANKTQVTANDSKTDNLDEYKSDSELDENDVPETIFECDTTIIQKQHQYKRESYEEEEEEKHHENDHEKEEEEVVTTVIIPKRIRSPEIKVSPKKRKVSESSSIQTPENKFKKFTPNATDEFHLMSPKQNELSPQKKFKKFSISENENSDFALPNHEDIELSSSKKKKHKSKDCNDDGTKASTSTNMRERNAVITQQCKEILLRKPAEDFIEYYATEKHNGSLKKSKKALKLLSDDEQKVIAKQHKKAMDKFTKKFNEFKESLTPSELLMITEKCLS